MSNPSTWLLAVIVALTFVAAIRVFNRLIRARNQCDNAWASADVNLKKRHDLVPNVVQAAKGYASHERALLERVIELRQQAGDKISRPQDMQAEADLGAALALLIARVEAYPDLKADQHFLRLQATLTEIEEQISAARRAYNAAVLEHNNIVEQFPSSIVASVTGFPAKPFFSADPVVHQAPTVSLR
jgi:LemA protein